ncbi:MAG: preprotein translocase subunit SecY [Phycisphaerae bacterium]|nr:preprotein translocase subunit SecY [Phycisphaerae bacterium]
MIRAFLNIFKVRDLRNKVLFTLGLLLVYRVGFYVPIPGVDQEKLAIHLRAGEGDGGLGQLTEYFAMVTGGNLNQSTLFGLGIMPYISASIIFQVLATVIPALEKLQREGESGRRKIQEYTRYATVLLCVIQGMFWLRYIQSGGLVYPEFSGTMSFWLMGLIGMTAGTIFLMWLGEQIDEYGIGNGISLIIMAGIVARMPNALIYLVQNMRLTIGSASGGEIGPGKIVFLLVAFVAVVAGSILITQAQRRIPIQQAKQTRGRRVYGGQRQYLPLRVNHGGVMPIIFASSLLLFPTMFFNWLNAAFGGTFSALLSDSFQRTSVIYALTYILMVYFFAYFWTTVQFQPKEMANQLRDYGSFIPGLRPGRRTAEYLERVMMHITYVGAGFLSVIALVPQVVADMLNIPILVSSFLGGTGLLIVVSVTLDLVQRIEANLVMRNYAGFLEGGPGGGPRIKGAYA